MYKKLIMPRTSREGTKMSRDIRFRKQSLSPSVAQGPTRTVFDVINCGFIAKLKMYSVSQGEIIATRDLSCNVLMKNIKECYWLRATNDHVYGLFHDDKGYVYFKMTRERPDKESPKMKVYLSNTREDLVSVAMSEHAYAAYIRDTRYSLDTIQEE
jgi:hypothetical protein